MKNKTMRKRKKRKTGRWCKVSKRTRKEDLTHFTLITIPADGMRKSYENLHITRDLYKEKKNNAFSVIKAFLTAQEQKPVLPLLYQ